MSFSDFERTKRGGVFFLVVGALFFLSLAGYKAYRWHVEARHWQEISGQFVRLVYYRPRRPRAVSDQAAIVSYVVNDQKRETQVSIPTEYIEQAKILQHGESYPPISLKVNSDDIQEVVADPKDAIWQDLTIVFWIIILAGIYYALHDPVTALFSVEEDEMGK